MLSCYLDGVLNNNMTSDLYPRIEFDEDTDHIRSNHARCDPIIQISR